MTTAQVALIAVPGLPDVQPGDDLAALIATALAAADLALQAGDVLAVAQKIVSKAENRYVHLDDVQPGSQALAVAAEVDKDPRLVELILRESDEISRRGRRVLIVRHRLGFVSANAGIDRSNVTQAGAGERVLLLPRDPDASAAALRAALHARCGVAPGIVITDSHGRPHRIGTVGVALGVAGLPALVDKRGTADRYGYTLQHTDIGLADEIAAAAGLLMGQAAEGQPVILLRGLQLPEGHGKASDLYRPKAHDLYR